MPRRFSRGARLLLFTMLLVLSAASCRTLPPTAPVRELQNYDFTPGSPVASRLRLVPPFVLSYLREMDGNDRYASYDPTDEEKRGFARYLDLLPEANRRVMEERLVAVYLVDGFQGSGLTDYLFAPDGSIYLFLVLNPRLLHTDISTWLTEKERSCFRDDASGIRIDINAGTRFTGLMYILLHESGHMLDYVTGFTPYVEPDLKGARAAGPFVRGLWRDYNRPEPEFDFPLRDRVSFYGLGGGPKIALAAAPDTYRRLAATPFVSLYGSQNWAEEFAELVTFHHLTATFGEPYEIVLRDGEKEIAVYAPMKSPVVKERVRGAKIP